MDLRRFLNHHWPHLLAAVFVAYTVALISHLIGAEQRLSEASHARLISDSQRRATAIADFVTARQQDISELADVREINDYFNNKALGMSARYGLNLSLDAIDQRFTLYLEQRTLRGQSLFNSIALLDTAGQVLASAGALGERINPLNELPQGSGLHVDSMAQNLTFYAPVRFNDRQVGLLVARADLQCITRLLLAGSGGDTANGNSTGNREILITNDGQPVLAQGQLPHPPAGIASLSRLNSRQLHVLPADGPGHSPWLAVRSPAGDYPLSIVTLLPEPEAHAQTSSPMLIAALSLFPVSVIAALLAYQRLYRRNLQLANEIARAEARTKAKSEFLATMSHEIRTPMNGIMGMIRLARQTRLDEEQQSYLNTAQHAADSLMTVINDILDFSKIEAGKLSLESLPVQLRHEIDELVFPLRTLAEDKGIHLEVRYPPGDPWVQCDPVRLRQILLNLLNNALKFTEHGEVRLSVERSQRPDGTPLFRFSVSDTGMGIPADQQARIFDSFTQADSSTSRRFGGTGLGLTIVSRLVRLFDGKISLDSTPGIGTTFCIDLPLLPAEAPATPAAEPTPGDIGPAVLCPPATPAASAPLDILVAEDNRINQMLIVKQLEKLGHRVRLVENGDEALAAYRSGTFDLILMDLHMPLMTGTEATQAIRQLEAEDASRGHTPIHALTAAALDEEREAAMQAGLDGYLTKPLEHERLLALLDTLATGKAG